MSTCVDFAIAEEWVDKYGAAPQSSVTARPKNMDRQGVLNEFVSSSFLPDQNHFVVLLREHSFDFSVAVLGVIICAVPSALFDCLWVVVHFSLVHPREYFRNGRPAGLGEGFMIHPNL